MTKQNETFKVCKTYVNGHQYVNKLVGRSALMKYQTKLFDVLGEKVISINITNCGRKERDINQKEEINERAMKAVDEHDTFKRQGKRKEKEEKSDVEVLADELGIDEESVKEVKNVFDKMSGDEEEDNPGEEDREESYDEESWKDRGMVVPEDD